MADMEKIVEDTAVELLRIAVTELPVEYVDAMEKGLEETEGSVGKAQLKNILENVGIARDGSKPMCQDTGIVAFMVKVGDGWLSLPTSSGIRILPQRFWQRNPTRTLLMRWTPASGLIQR